MTDLAGILSDWGIRLKSQRPGHTEHVVCPKCGGGRTRESCLAVSIDADGLGAVVLCHRGTCGWQDGARVHNSAPPPKHPRAIQRPAPHSAKDVENQPDWLCEFFFERKIGMRTIKAFGCYATTRHFNGLGERDAIVFPYFAGGEVVNRKYRARGDKRGQAQEKDALQTLFNVDRLGEAPHEIVWVEGEPDVMALFECGIENAVSLKDGAPAKPAPGKIVPESDKRFEALRTHGDLLDKPKRIILAGDMDGPGLVLREELARRLGRHRCLVVTWPGGHKDACDVLRALGPEAVTQAIAEAQPYPIEGLQRVQPGVLSKLRHSSPPQTMTTGARSTDAVLKLPTEGRLIVVTGFPTHGKTTWTKFIMVHTAGNHERSWAVFSPEMQPWAHFAAECAEVWSGKPFWPTPGLESMSDADIADAEMWLSDRVTMVVADSEDQPPTLDWLIECFRSAVLRDGVTDVLVDPWNEVEHHRGELTETEYIGRSLQRLKAFALRHGCNVWVIAHPAKPPPIKPGEKRLAPGPYDLAGSAHWANKSDLGITLHSPQQGEAEVHVWKTRFRRWGRRGDVALLDFDGLCGRYSTPIAKLAETEPPYWNDPP